VGSDTRFSLVSDMLEDNAHRPAIVYVPRRRDAGALSDRLEQAGIKAAEYHAGLDGKTRERVQTAFLSGELDVIVATIAFGMGIDKPNVRTVIHTALPGSVEGYYQEIGRAGRDGQPSRAILMHHYADRFTHDFFFERDYPQAAEIRRVYDRLTETPQPKEAVEARVGMHRDEFENALEKLWIHGGAIVDYEDNVSRGAPGWRELYEAQREHKMAQFDRMFQYTEGASCRMLELLRYFGDTADLKHRCGICDICNPSAAVVQRSRPANESERAMVASMLDTLRATDRISAGRLYAAVSQDGATGRREFEDLMNAAA
jgi:DNA topoisomerase-3